jgi:hypothetical protein
MQEIANGSQHEPGLQIRALGILLVGPRPHGVVLDTPIAPWPRIARYRSADWWAGSGRFYLWGELMLFLRLG